MILQNEYKSRFNMLTGVANARTAYLRECLLSTDPVVLRKRKLRRKTDGTGITRIEHRVGGDSFDEIDEIFPDDSIRGEEVPGMDPRAQFEWVWDESDNTKETSKWRRPNPHYEPSQATPAHLIACIDHGEYGNEDNPFAFGAGYPLRNEVYTGCQGLGIFRNGDKLYSTGAIQGKQSNIVIGVNEHEEKNNTFLSERLGTKLTGYNAGAVPFFLIHGHIGGALLHYDTKNVEELPCIVATALILGAIVTDERGRPYRFHNQQPNIDARIVITLHHLLHNNLRLKSEVVVNT